MLVVTTLTASCGGASGGDPADSIADAAAEVVGEELFYERVIGSNPGCITCHSLEAGVTLVGPSLAGISARAATTVPGLSAMEYLRLSITDPDSYVVDGFVAGSMPNGWDEALSDSQIDSLVDFLLGS
jgi:mono/diheme cytochrome c family protein